MRILNVAQTYFPYLAEGGRPAKVRALSKGLAQRGHQVTVLTVDLGPSNWKCLGIAHEESAFGFRHSADGVDAVYLSTLLRFRAFTINPYVIGFCRADLRKFDLVHIYGLYDLLGPTVSHFCRRQGIPYVIEPMGMYRPIVRNIRLKKIYHILLGRQLVAGARFVIATSEQEKQELIEGGIQKSRVVVRRNGIEFPSELAVRGEFRRRWSIPEDAKVVLFLGRVVSKKSPDLLIEAFARWRKSSACGGSSVLVLAGPLEDRSFVSCLRGMAERLGLGSNVLFAGPLYDTEKWQAFRDADVFVLPSQNENFGNTAAESAVCGTPVIVTDRCGIAPYVGEAGVVIPYSREALEQALEKLLGDPKMLRRCQEGCREMTRSLSWDDPLDMSEDLYVRCLSEDGR